MENGQLRRGRASGGGEAERDEVKGSGGRPWRRPWGALEEAEGDGLNDEDRGESSGGGEEAG